MRLGTLKQVDLREYWKHEALDFTRWLSEEENIAILSDEIGIGIEVLQTEASVGRFNVDILAQEENTDRKIIIENQLEMTDHTHLGQLITYAAGLEAEYVIWIVRQAREEHRQAVDWLNERTGEEINFFLVELQLWKIGDSDPAPKFSILSRPNEWKKSVKSSAQDGDLSDTKTKQLEFWEQLKEFASVNYPELRLQTPRPRHWFDVAIGRSDCRILLIADSRENQVRCELYIPDSKALFRTLRASALQVEKELALGAALDWYEPPGKKAARIRVVRDSSFADPDTWPGAFEWLCKTAVKFKKVFGREWKVIEPSTGDYGNPPTGEP